MLTKPFHLYTKFLNFQFHQQATYRFHCQIVWIIPFSKFHCDCIYRSCRSLKKISKISSSLNFSLDLLFTFLSQKHLNIFLPKTISTLKSFLFEKKERARGIYFKSRTLNFTKIWRPRFLKFSVHFLLNLSTRNLF